MSESKKLETTVFLTLTPKFRRSPSGDLTATEFVVSKATKNRPQGREPVVLLKLRIPAAAFAPLAPVVTIEVPEDGLAWPEPTITVENVSDDAR